MSSAVLTLGRSSWNSYCQALERKPLLTKALTAGAGFAIGDLIAQGTTSRQPFVWDYKRTARLTAFGLLVAGPIQGHLWFNFLDKASTRLHQGSVRRFAVLHGRSRARKADVPKELVTMAVDAQKDFLTDKEVVSFVQRVSSAGLTKATAVVSKILLDQAINAPIGTACFFAFTKALEGKLGEAPQKIKQDLLPTCVTGWKLWLPAHVINFGVIPLQQRVLYTNVVAIAWTYILSQASAGGDEAQGQAA